MQNNEFEKQVRERMGQIKFTPSEAVWAEVQKNLKHRRKRRIAIVWLFVFFIAAGGSSLAWFYFSPANTGIANHDFSSTKKNATDVPSVANTPDQDITSSPNKKENSETDNIETSPSKNNADVETKEAGQAAATTSGVSQKNSVSSSKTTTQKNKNVSPGSSLNIETSGSSAMKNKGKNSSAAALATTSPIAASKNGDKVNAKVEAAQDIAVKENTAIPDSATTQKDSTVSLVKTTAVDSTATSASTVKINTKTKNKWQFGFTIGAGMSDVVNPISGAKSMDVAYAAPPSYNLSAPGSSAQNPALPGPGTFIYPSELNSGLSFSIGAEATKKIKKRMSVNVGLQYHYYSTSIVVGRYLDSVSQRNNNSSFLAAGPRENNHRNTYHFAELPVTMGFQVLKNKPLQLTAGLSVGYLFASNVLIYDKSQGVYYNDKDALNKTQLNVLLGLSWTFAQKSKTPIQVGPSMSYGASNVSSKSGNGSNHMFSIGGSAKIMFHKK